MSDEKHEEIDLSAEEWEAADAAWDEIRAEAKAKKVKDDEKVSE